VTARECFMTSVLLQNDIGDHDWASLRIDSEVSIQQTVVELSRLRARLRLILATSRLRNPVLGGGPPFGFTFSSMTKLPHGPPVSILVQR